MDRSPRTNADPVDAKRFLMKLFAGAVLVLITVATPAFARGSAPEPTPFEAFALKPSVVIAFTQQVGTIESSDASVKISALIISDTANPSERMRGVRFTLESNAGLDHVFLDEAQLAALKGDLADIEAGIPELKANQDAPYRVQGTGSCWMPARPVRIMCPSYRVGPDWSGLTLGAYGGPGFAYPGHRPSELTELIDRAVTELQAPRPPSR